LKMGLATIEAYSGAPVAQADLVAQWISLTPGWAGMSYRFSWGRPVIYLESHLGPAGYQDLIEERYDRALGDIKADLPVDAIVRWDHEMDGPANEWRTWGGMEPRRYKRGWRHVAEIMGPMFWCPTSVKSRWDPYFPGAEYVSHVGFDYYDHGKRIPLTEGLKTRLAALRRLAPDKPQLLGELGSAAIKDVCGRTEWLASLAGNGLWGAVYFDVDMSVHPQPGPDWRMNDEMRDVFQVLAA